MSRKCIESKLTKKKKTRSLKLNSRSLRESIMDDGGSDMDPFGTNVTKEMTLECKGNLDHAISKVN